MLGYPEQGDIAKLQSEGVTPLATTQILDLGKVVGESTPAAFIVDGDSTLVDWATNNSNPNGDKYLVVVFKPGMYTINNIGAPKKIDCAVSGTKRVFGNGATLRLDQAGWWESTPMCLFSVGDCIVEGLNIHCSDTNFGSGNFTVFGGDFTGANPVGTVVGCTITMEVDTGNSKLFSVFAGFKACIACTVTGAGYKYSTAGFHKCACTGCAVVCSVVATSGMNGFSYGFKNCNNSVNCYTSNGVILSAFDSCDNLMNCAVESNVNSGNGFESCHKFANCSVTGNAGTTAGKYSFQYCSDITLCSVSATGGKFNGCDRGVGNRSIGGYQGCFMDSAYTKSWNDTADGGYNSIG